MSRLEKLQTLLDLIGCEEPLGIAYAEAVPKGSVTIPPAGGHACVINYLRMARTKKHPVHFAADVKGCMGGWVYMGFTLPPPPRIAHFVTTGWEGFDGERYLPSPDSMHRFFKDIDLQPAPAPICVAQPLSMFEDAAAPVVAFHCRAEELTGLSMLAGFALDDANATVMPFGSGCANIFTWPLTYQRKGLKKAVIGGADPSCRPFMKVDELSFAMTGDVLDAMLDAVPRSFLMGKTWSGVRKKIAKSRDAWGD